MQEKLDSWKEQFIKVNGRNPSLQEFQDAKQKIAGELSDQQVTVTGQRKQKSVTATSESRTTKQPVHGKKKGRLVQITLIGLLLLIVAGGALMIGLQSGGNNERGTVSPTSSSKESKKHSSNSDYSDSSSASDSSQSSSSSPDPVAVHNSDEAIVAAQSYYGSDTYEGRTLTWSVMEEDNGSYLFDGGYYWVKASDGTTMSGSTLSFHVYPDGTVVDQH